MNKEKKEEIEKKLRTNFVSLVNETEIKLMVEAYLLGAKDLWEAVKVQSLDAETDIAEGFNDCAYEVDTKAQQFLDGLKGKDDTN